MKDGMPPCCDCNKELCKCFQCHTMNCDSEQLCGYQKKYIKGYGVLKKDE